MALPLGDRNRHRAVFSVAEGSFVPIGERTSDNGIRVQEKSPLDMHSGFLPCRCFFYGFGSVAVSGCTTAPGHTGGGRARPPFWTAWIGSAGWAHVHSPCHVRGIAPVHNYPCGKAVKPSESWQGKRGSSPAIEFFLRVPQESEILAF